MAQVSGGAQWVVRKGGSRAGMALGYLVESTPGELCPTADAGVATHVHSLSAGGEIVVVAIGEEGTYGTLRMAIRTDGDVQIYGATYTPPI